MKEGRMIMNKKIIAMLMTAAMTVTLITGCGAGAASSGKSNAIADGVLTIGTNAEFPPFEYVGDNGEPDGFDIALINAIGEKLGVEVEVENMEFDSLVSSIGSKIDVAIAGMTVTEERKQSVDFSDPYFDAVQHVLVPAGSDIKSYEDLEGKIIGCQLGTTGDFIVEEIEGAESHQYNKALQAVEDLVNGKLDAVIIDSNPAAVFTSNYPDKIRNLDGEDFGFEPEHYAIAMPKGDKALADAVNKAISELKADGTFDALVEKYIQQ
jgi:polar amino acid transport system substrate-binding protein